MNNGFIKLHRDIVNHWIFSYDKILKVWIWLLCKAQWQDKTISLNNNTGLCVIHLKRGQVLFGRNISCQELKIKPSSLYRYINVLQKQKIISIKTNNKYSIITICNYDKYQSVLNENDILVNSKRTTIEQQENTNKNIKNIKEDKEEYIYHISSVEKFYKDQVTEAQAKGHDTHDYERYIAFLFGKSKNNVSPLTNVLMIKHQLTFDEHEYLSPFTNFPLKVLELNRYNHARHHSVYHTVKTWLEKDKMKEQNKKLLTNINP